MTGFAGGDEQDAMVLHAVNEATGHTPEKRPKNDVSDREVVVLGSGNLGLVYLMEEKRRLTFEELEERHPRLLTALREHPHVGWVLVHSSEHGGVVLGAHGARYLDEDRVDGEDPLANFSPTAAQHLRRTNGFKHAPDVMLGSFYDQPTSPLDAQNGSHSIVGSLRRPSERLEVSPGRYGGLKPL